MRGVGQRVVAGGRIAVGVAASPVVSVSALL